MVEHPQIDESALLALSLTPLASFPSAQYTSLLAYAAAKVEMLYEKRCQAEEAYHNAAKAMNTAQNMHEAWRNYLENCIKKTPPIEWGGSLCLRESIKSLAGLKAPLLMGSYPSIQVTYVYPTLFPEAMEKKDESHN